MPKSLIPAALALLATLGLLDFIWLGSMTESFYRPRLAHLLAADLRPAPALAFYLLYATGLGLFVLVPALRISPQTGRPLGVAVVRGAAFGLVAYGTYDLTNLATLRDWPLDVTLVDMTWGAAISAMACGNGVLVAMLLQRRGSAR